MSNSTIQNNELNMISLYVIYLGKQS